MYYSLCAGQTKAGPYGYSPLPLNLVQAGFQQLAKLKQADRDVDLTDRDVRSCNNPTFDGKNLGRNVLADKAPQPAACDKARCRAVRHRDRHQPAQHRRRNRRRWCRRRPVPAAVAGDPAVAVVAEETRPPRSTPRPARSWVRPARRPARRCSPAPTELMSERSVDRTAFGWLAALELLALVLLPGLLVVALRRRRVATAGRTPL